MKIALLGYGRMGKAIASIAKERGHEVVAIVDPDTQEGTLSQAEVAINFSVPDAAVNNIKSALKIGVPVVCGTTGWLDQIAEVEAYCQKQNSAFLYASNFSIGVNLFFSLN
ncbi:MAG: NAD(P)-binding domain-containing protein, partial [Flavobacteriaceae bacterium]